MPSIGGTSFIFIRDGRPQPLGQIVERVTRPGVNGVKYRLEGAQPEPFVVTAVRDVDSAAAHKSMMASFVAMRGTLVNLVDDLGNGYDRVMVHRVRDVQCKRLLTVSGGVSLLKAYLSVFEFELELTE